MLDTLRRLSHQVSTAKDLNEALRLIVGEVRRVMNADVCSVYLTDPATGERVLMATEGLRSDAVGRVRLGPDEGLVGLVCSRAEPVNVEDAPSHPAYRYFPETGEEAYHGFLGVPIIHQGRPLGALVVQQRNQRRFSDEEETLLVTLAAQLAGAIAHAEAVDGFAALAGRHGRDRPFQGLSGAPGVAVGQAVVLYPPTDLAAVPDRPTDDPEEEIRRFLAAVQAVRADIDRLEARIGHDLPQADRALFEAYRLMLDSDSIQGKTIARIELGQWAPGALRETIEEHRRAFLLMDDPYLRERAEDIRDLGRRLLERLHHSASETPLAFPENGIAVGDSLGPAALIDLPLERVRGLVSRQGSGSSHAAILARALGIPAVMGLSDLPLEKLDGKTLVVDGYQGRVFVDPSPAVCAEFARLAREEDELQADLEPLRDLPAVTRDGHRVALYANTGLLSELEPVRDNGAEGIGLYRTEFPFMMRDRFPSESEQGDLYRRILEACAPAPVTLRTLDIGGDKPLPYFPIHEDNPFLGWRGLRVCLDHPEIFLTQIRAMLRANAGLGNLHILLPMITTPAEVDQALHLIGRAHRELCEHHPDLPLPKVGAMIEVPSAVSSAGAIARRVDFISIGTNDLVQYLLAVDRNNNRVAGLYDALHPAVIDAIDRVLHAAGRQGKPVSVCGEMASDPAAALLLVGLGLDSLSINAVNIPRIKWLVRNVELAQARRLTEAVREMEEAHQVRHHLHGELERLGLGGLIRAGK